MAELLMGCSDEALEPWQMEPEVIEIEDNEDDPIFVREVVWLDPPLEAGAGSKHSRMKGAPPASSEGDVCLSPVSNAEAPSTAQPGSGHTAGSLSDQQTTPPSSSTPVAATGCAQPGGINIQLGPAAVPIKTSPALGNQQCRSDAVSKAMISDLGQIRLLMPQDPARASFNVLQAGHPVLPQGTGRNLANMQLILAPKLLPTAQLINSIPQPAAQSSLSAPPSAAQSSLSTPPSAAQAGLSTPPSAAQARLATPPSAAQASLSTPPSAAQASLSTPPSAAQSSPSAQQSAAQSSPSIPQPAAQSSPSIAQPAAQFSPSTPHSAAQSSPSTPQPAAQSSIMTLQPAAKSTPITLQKATHLRLLTPFGAAYPTGKLLTLLPGHPVLPHGTLVQLANVPSTSQSNQSAAQLANGTPQPAAQTSTVNQQTVAHPTSASRQPAALSTVKLQLAAHRSSVNPQTAAHPASASRQPAAQSGTDNQQTDARPTSASRQPAAQSDSELQTWVVQPVPMGPRVPELQLLSLMSQAPPTSPVTREARPPGGTKQGSQPHPMNSDPVSQIPGIGSTNCPNDALVLRPVGNKCPTCDSQFSSPCQLRRHKKECSFHLKKEVITKTTLHTPAPQRRIDSQGKLVMLVGEYYYGNRKGDKTTAKKPKSDVTFTCPSCSRVLRNNIGFIGHMRYHLDLLWQESQGGLTTCEHCYRRCSTPLNVRLHTERVHVRSESKTTCKICEIAFDTEQILLEHMRDTHKPGEMPYACQVCNYRSSFFSELEDHFRMEHENTKGLLCPFCLKVLEGVQMYAKHYMKHQDEEVYQCDKCRLNFLSLAEKVVHDSHFHRTFKKPRILKKLPLGTEVVICASLPAAFRPDSLENRPIPPGILRLNGALLADRPGKKHKKDHSNARVDESLECVICGFLIGLSHGDMMSRHLTENPHHSCRVIGGKGTLDPIQRKMIKLEN